MTWHRNNSPFEILTKIAKFSLITQVSKVFRVFYKKIFVIFYTNNLIMWRYLEKAGLYFWKTKQFSTSIWLFCEMLWSFNKWRCLCAQFHNIIGQGIFVALYTIEWNARHKCLPPYVRGLVELFKDDMFNIKVYF